MNKEDSLTSEQAFVLGVQNHKKNNFREAENFYKKTIKKILIILTLTLILELYLNNCVKFKKQKIVLTRQLK